jgi:hypothetical protein
MAERQLRICGPNCSVKPSVRNHGERAGNIRWNDVTYFSVLPWGHLTAGMCSDDNLVAGKVQSSRKST